MKRFVALILVLAASFAANAAYLYWQIEDTDSVPGISLPSDFSGTAAMWARNDSTGEFFGNAPLTSSYDGGSAQYVPAPDFFNEYVIDLTGLGIGEGYSFIIELKNASNETVGYSQFMTYSDAVSSQYITSGSISDMPSVQTWHGGTYAAPEPTSAMLMLLGTAFLGLRRRQRSAA